VLHITRSSKLSLSLPNNQTRQKLMSPRAYNNHANPDSTLQSTSFDLTLMPARGFLTIRKV